MSARIWVRPADLEDHDRWRELYAGYAAFYGVDQSDAMAERVWGWVRDPAHELECLLAVDATVRVVGLAHFRSFARPLTATVGGFLDDLFVDPAARGTGAGQALLGALADIAADRGWSVVRWITAEDNARARALYDRRATQTGWVTYDMAPATE